MDEEKVIRQMVVLVFGTRWEVFLDEFMKNLIKKQQGQVYTFDINVKSVDLTPKQKEDGSMQTKTSCNYIEIDCTYYDFFHDTRVILWAE